MTAARRQSEPGELPVKRNSAQLALGRGVAHADAAILSPDVS
jgi:hypothetical protein